MINAAVVSQKADKKVNFDASISAAAPDITSAGFLSALIAARDGCNDIIVLSYCTPPICDISLVAQKLNKSILVLLPGSVYIPNTVPFFEYPNKKTARYSCFELPHTYKKVIAADVRCLMDEAFVNCIKSRGIDEVFLPFAECALPYVYGYRAAYCWLPEVRAALPQHIHITAFLYGDKNDAISVSNKIQLNSAVIMSLGGEINFRRFNVNSTAQKYALCAGMCKKLSGRTAVITPTRRECSELYSALKKAGINSGTVTGETSKKYVTGILSNSEISVIAATKSFIPYSLFFGFSHIIFCGVPYSKSFLARCTALCPNTDIYCVYSNFDALTLNRLILRKTEYSDDYFAPDITEKRINELNSVKKMLNISN